MPLAGIESALASILGNQALVLTLGGIGLAGYYLFKKFENENIYEDKEPDEITREYLKRELENGKSVKKDLKDNNAGDIINRGKVLYQLADEMPDKVISPVIDPNSGDEELEPDSEIRMYKVRPKNASVFKYVLFDVLMDKDEVAEYYLLSKSNIEEYDDEIVIKDGVNLEYARGIFTDRTTESNNKANQVIRLASQNELVKGHVNYARKVNHQDPTHSMSIEEIGERKEENDER